MKVYQLAILAIPIAFVNHGCGDRASFRDSSTDLNQRANAGGSSDSTAAATSIDSASGDELSAGSSSGDAETDAGVANAADDGKNSKGNPLEATSGNGKPTGVVASPGTGTAAGTGQGIPRKITATELAAKCASSTVVAMQQVVTFAEPAGTCAWGTDSAPNLGNLGQLDSRVSARLEQDIVLAVPSNALLCSLSLDFIPDGTAGQNMVYDDEIFMTFNNVILAASQSYDTAFEKKDGYMMYDWNRLAGKPYTPTGFQQYCLGADQALGSCSIPPTQTPGVMKVTLSDALVQGIAASTGVTVAASGVAPNTSKFKFSFVTIGDNDAPDDCKHSKFEFQAAAKYVIFK